MLLMIFERSTKTTSIQTPCNSPPNKQNDRTLSLIDRNYQNNYKFKLI